MTRINADNLFGVTQYIVDASAALGSFTSVQAAINQAVADGHNATNPATVFIRAGEYVEDVTMATGVSLVGFSGFTFQAPFLDPNLVSQTNIKGQLTANYSGVGIITGITFSDNGAAPLLMNIGPGPLPTILVAWNCTFYSANAPCMIVSAPDANFQGKNCIFQQEGAFGYLDISDGESSFTSCIYNSFNHSSLNSTVSGNGQAALSYCDLDSGFTCTGAGRLQATYTSMSSDDNSVIITSSSGDMILDYCRISSNFMGASCVDIALGSTIRATGTQISGGATPEVNGFGTLQYDHIFDANTLAATLTTTVFSTLPIAGTSLSNRGHAYFNPTDFTVSPTGEVFSNHTNIPWFDQPMSALVTKNSGNYITGAAVTLTLPVGPSQGDLCEFCVVGANSPAVVQASPGQLIQLGSAVSSIGGTATSSGSGDSLRLVFRLADQTWYSVPGTQGVWVVA